jgi:hypothetical protein
VPASGASGACAGPPPPNRFSKKPPAVGVLTILRAAIVLAEGHQDSAALPLALAAVALQPLDLGQGAVEVRPHLLDLVVKRSALRRLAAEQREEAAALATQALRLLSETIQFGLLLRR